MVYQNALRPAWTPLTIVLMVIGFAVAWPLGLLMLAYILFGERIPEVRRHFEGVRQDWETNRRDWCGPRGGRHNAYQRTGNSAFDDYRAAELKRLEEERRRLEGERREFDRYADNLRRARDKDEFDRFMAERANRKPGGGETIDV